MDFFGCCFVLRFDWFLWGLGFLFLCLFYLWLVLFCFDPKHNDLFIDPNDMRYYFMQIEVVLEKGAGTACNELLGISFWGFPVCTGQSVVCLIFTRTVALTFLLYSPDKGPPLCLRNPVVAVIHSVSFCWRSRVGTGSSLTWDTL